MYAKRRRAGGRAALVPLVLCALTTTAAAPVTAQERLGTVVGRVVDGFGQPVGSLDLQAMRDGRAIASASTDGDGRYAMRVEAGEAVIAIAAGLGIPASEGEPFTVAAGGTVTADMTVDRSSFILDQLVVTGTASTSGAEAMSAGGIIPTVTEREIRRSNGVNPTDVVAHEPGVDFVPTGIIGRTLSFRGFGNIFSGAVRYLVDYRNASIPSLRANFTHFAPNTTSDLERMELVLGPSSAIYGPNSANGVLNVLTRSPLGLSESSASISTGSQSLVQTELRASQRLGEHWGIKVSGRWFQADEYLYADPVEVATRQLIDTDPGTWRDALRDVGVSEAEIAIREPRVGIRDNAIERWSLDGRLDWTPIDGDTLMIQGGRTSSSGIEVTPLGAAQAGDWRYDYAQARYKGGSFFAQAFVNTSSAGETYLLRDGASLVDDSRLVGLQLRHGFSFADGAEEITYGGDWARTTPKTGGTIHGVFEDDDEITEYGGYVQSRTRLAPFLHVVGTLRVDESNVIEDPVLSPRVGLVVRPAEGHSFSASWSRGFSTPTPPNYFLDISAGTAPDDLGMLGYRLRARGTGRDGIRFSDGMGGYQGMRSTCTPPAAGGASALIPASSTNVWQCAVGVMEQTGAIDAATAAYLRTLDPADAVTVNAVDPLTESARPLTPGAVADIAPLSENTATTIEVSYKGLVASSLFVQAAVWRTERQNFTSPLIPVTPLVTLDGPELAAFLASQGLSPEEAAAIATGAARIPGGILSSADIQGTGAEMVLSYENFGEISYWGADVGLEADLTRSLALTGSASWISADHFDVAGRFLPLNAPEFKASAALGVDELAVPLVGSLGLRYHSGFPVASGDYVGLACMGAAPDDSEDCVDSATLVDASLGWEGLFAQEMALRVSVENVLGTEYRAFVGVPTTGRVFRTRLEYRLR